jgi:hypothetical protein
MSWTIPTSEEIRIMRLRDGPNYNIPQEYLGNLLKHDDTGAIYFPIYALNGTQIGWNVRAAEEKKWSQTLFQESAPRFTSWTPHIAEIVHSSRKIMLVEGPFDALALAPIVPWVISTNTARVQQEILEWCKMWRLHVFTALDFDLPDPKTNRKTGQDATIRITKELYDNNCNVNQISWPNTSPTRIINGIPNLGVQLKDPAQAYAVMGPEFHSIIKQQISRISSVIHH